ncbi:MAG TPA: cupin domain-containing protein [Stellaceae bacterium]|nr:cupin domain-containing protein [Stellaceae bacterium]
MSTRLKIPAFDPGSLPLKEGSSYPEAFRAAVQGRRWRALGDAIGLTQFGVNLVELAPRSWSSQRHWHTHEDELIFVLEGELVLITDEGEQTMTAGSAAGFPAAKENGHHLVNRSGKPARFLAIGSRSRADSCHYPDVDLVERQDASGYYYTHKDGTRY